MIIQQATEKKWKEACIFDEGIHLFSSDSILEQKRYSYPFNQKNMPSEKITSMDDVFNIYSYVRSLIQNTKKLERNYEEQAQDWHQNFYQKKALLFYKFYNCERVISEVKNIAQMFDTLRLQQLFKSIGKVWSDLKESVKSLKDRKQKILKINILLLTFKVQTLLKQIKNAASPYSNFTLSQNRIDQYQLTQEEFKKIQSDKKIMKNKNRFVLKFFNETNENPLYEFLNQLREFINERIKELKNVVNSEQSLRIGKQLQELQNLHKKYEVYSFWFRYYHKKIGKAELSKFIKDQTNVLSKNQNIFLDEGIERYFKYFQFIIQDIERREQSYGCTEQSQQISWNLLKLLQNWISAILPSKSLLLYKNYVAVLLIYTSADKSYIKLAEKSLFNNLDAYLNLLITDLIKENEKELNSIIELDQKFTSELISSSNIVKTLISYKQKWNTPYLSKLAYILKIKKQKQNANYFIKQIIKEGSFTSKIQDPLHQTHENFDFDILQDVEEEHLIKIKPYLRQIKYTYWLNIILNKSNVTGSMYRAMQEEYCQLQKIAAYFSKARKCISYEIKSKLLLFITLFKMGYYNPTIKDEQNSINLAIRIKNLYRQMKSTHEIVLNRQNSKNNQAAGEIYNQMEGKLNRQQDSQSIEQQKGLQILHLTKRSFQQDEEEITQSMKQIDQTKILKSIESQLFILENNIQQLYHDKLSKDYIDHLKKYISKDHISDEHMITLLKFQQIFFIGKTIRAWNLLIQQKEQNPQFKTFMEQFDCQNTERQSLKLARMHHVFENNLRNNIYFSESFNSEEAISILYQSVNERLSNPDNEISVNVVRTLYKRKAKQMLFEQLKKYRQMKSNGMSQKLNYDFEEIQIPQFEKKGIKYSIYEKGNKTILKIQISESYKDRFDQIKMKFSAYQLLNQIGIYKISDIQITNHSQIIFIESNPLIFERQSKEIQSFLKKILQITVQAMSIFHRQLKNDLQLFLFNFKRTCPLSFCINPFLGIIKNLLFEPQLKAIPINVKNQLIIENLMSGFVPNDFKQLYWNYQYFLSSLININSHSDSTKLLKLPLFLAYSQKESQIVYFNNVSAAMASALSSKQHELRFDGDQNHGSDLAANEFRLKTMMTDKQYRKYEYLYQVGSVSEEQLKQLKMFIWLDNGRLDWITGHEHLVKRIDFKLKKNEDKSYNIVNYGFCKLIQCLRDSLAHKSQDDNGLVKRYIEEYPRLIDYLFQDKVYLKMSLKDILQDRNNWFEAYFDISQDKLNRLRMIIDGTMEPPFAYNAYTLEAIGILKNHKQEKYPKIREFVLKMPKFYCKKCKYFIDIIKNFEDYVSFLKDASNFIRQQRQNRGTNDFLSDVHSEPSCFFQKAFKDHITMQVSRKWKVTVQHFIIKNWWYYLETTLPCLIKCLQKIRYLIDL